jgi:UDP-glucose 4-epimerase
MSTLRAEVLGADGFIGRHLTAALCATGTRVIAYTRSHQPYRPDSPDIVFYLASSITPALAEQHPEWVREDHRRFATLLGHLGSQANPPTVVLTSSAGTVYDPDAPGPWDEEAPTRATNRYGAAKLELERLLLDHADTVPGVVLRLSNVYGPGQRVDKSQGVLAYWLRAAAADRPVPVIGDPQARRDYVYVHDVVDCLLRVAAWSPTLAASPPQVVNVASGCSTSLADLLSIVELVVGRDLAVELLPGRAVDRRDTSLDVRRATRWLGWHPRTSLVEGITEMWQSLRPETERASTAAGARGSRLYV